MFLIIILILRKVEKQKKRKFFNINYIIAITHIAIIIFFIFRLIPPVPLALKTGLVAHHVKKIDDQYEVTYKSRKWYKIWTNQENELKFKASDSVFVFTSIFSPKNLSKKVFHKWSHYNAQSKEWEMTDRIGYVINGGRSNGYRGYTYKTHLMEGDWKVEVITEEDLIIGVVDFNVNLHDGERTKKLKTEYF